MQTYLTQMLRDMYEQIGYVEYFNEISDVDLILLISHYYGSNQAYFCSFL